MAQFTSLDKLHSGLAKYLKVQIKSTLCYSDFKKNENLYEILHRGNGFKYLNSDRKLVLAKQEKSLSTV